MFQRYGTSSTMTHSTFVSKPVVSNTSNLQRSKNMCQRPKSAVSVVCISKTTSNLPDAVIAKKAAEIYKKLGVKNDNWCWYKAIEELTPKSYGTESKGEMASKEYKMFVTGDGEKISPWHDIPLQNPDKSFNFICEIPKNTTAKMEVSTKHDLNPIEQDRKQDKKTKKIKLRDYPYAINWNYGMLPQTWEDPKHKTKELPGVKGDNDPVDVVEIGSRALPSGTVSKVKVLGAYAMIDEGEVDWKIIAINMQDPMAASVNDVADVEAKFPGELEKIKVWFRDYKIPDGKEPNRFGLGEKCISAAEAVKVIDATHTSYNKLIMGKVDNKDELALCY